MGKEPRPFTITLSETEAAILLEPHGDGGHQKLQEHLREQLADNNLTVTFGDAQLGKIIRYMTQYGSGGFQGRLQKAFREPLRRLLTS